MPNHIPSLSPQQLPAALQAIQRLPINQRAKVFLKQILTEAAIPDRHDAERLKSAQAANIRTYSERVVQHSRGMVERAAADLLALPDEEWERLVEEANRESGTA